jgi:hypothetical protein
MLLKCADVNNPAKEQKLYQSWTDMIIKEFLLQGDEERRMSLPISPFMDSATLRVSTMQIGFIEFICQPLYDAFHNFVQITPAMTMLKSNWDAWKAIKAQEDAEILQEQERADMEGKLDHSGASNMVAHFQRSLSQAKEEVGGVTQRSPHLNTSILRTTSFNSSQNSRNGSLQNNQTQG